jgi:hypothetical protein
MASAVDKGWGFQDDLLFIAINLNMLSTSALSFTIKVTGLIKPYLFAVLNSSFILSGRSLFAITLSALFPK